MHGPAYFLGALGNLHPRARSILAMIALFGIAFPLSYSLTMFGCIWSCCASCFCVSPLAFLAWANALFSSVGTLASAHRGQRWHTGQLGV